MTEDRDEGVRMIRESAAGIAPRTGDFRRIRALRFTEPGFDRAVFREMCQMGWLGLMISEDAGGSGLGMREFCALTEELGASLMPEPLITAAMAAKLLPESHLSDVLTGDRIVLPAW
jgi:alkylation response protein AidB-like acyl-CoA dehydrogenase